MNKHKLCGLWVIAVILIITGFLPIDHTYAQPNNVFHTELTSLHEHLYVGEQILPTCDTAGFVMYHCSCGDSFLDDYIPARGHIYTSRKYEATCISAGYTQYSCSCGFTFIGDKQEAVPHVYEQCIIVPTCTNKGYTLYACMCGDSYAENYIDATGHDYVRTTKKATCESDGYTLYSCHCGHSYQTNQVEKLGHKYTASVVKPTFKSQGYTKYTCSKCGDSYKDSYTDKLTVPEEIKSRPGMIGRLTIPDVGVNVALFYSYKGENGVSIVDRKDSAMYMETSGQYIIGDHKTQGFDKMKKSVPGKTVAYIDFGTHVQKYLCIANFVGTNTGHGVLDGNGVNIKYQKGSDIAMYTCNEHWTSVTITYWKKV